MAAIVSVFLVRMIGEKRARELLLSGRLIDSTEACRIGLINEVVPADQILSRARQLAAELTANSPQSLGAIKRFVGSLNLPELDSLLEKACDLNASARQTEDCKEGVRAFLEKRAPRWNKSK